MIEDFSPLEVLSILDVKSKLKVYLSQHLDLTIEKVKTNPATAPRYYVSGGCIGSLLRGEEPNDYDVYFYEKEYADSILRLFKDDPSFQNEVAQIDEKYREVSNLPDGRMITENAITLKNKIQLITKHYGEPAVIRATFDFIHCMPYYDRFTDKLNISKEQYDLNMQKKMKLNKGVYQTYRQEKFLIRGWSWQ